MKRLGAIIAGGKATRFGADKAAALLHGQPLMEHVADGLRDQVDKLIVCGRAWPGMDWIEDRPFADMGPLGGLNAALHYAQQNGFDEVVTAGGVLGKVSKLGDSFLGLEVSNGVEIQIQRSAVVQVLPKGSIK